MPLIVIAVTHRFSVVHCTVVSAHAHLGTIPTHEFIDARGHLVCRGALGCGKTDAVVDRGAPFFRSASQAMCVNNDDEDTGDGGKYSTSTRLDSSPVAAQVENCAYLRQESDVD